MNGAINVTCLGRLMIARAVVNKLLHSPVRHLKEAASAGQAEEVVRTYRDIFDLQSLDAPQPEEAEGGSGHAQDRMRFARGRES